MKLKSLQLYLFWGMQRVGKINLVFFGIIFLCVVGTQGVVKLSEKNIVEQSLSLKNLEWDLSKVTSKSSDTTTPENELRLKAFEEVLSEAKYLEQDLKKVLAIANETEVSLRMGEYKLTEDAAGEFLIYHLQFPVKGNYQSLRHFVEKTLLLLPNASLDEMTFKRESIAQMSLDSRVKFSVFYQRPNQVKSKKSFE